MTRAQAKFTPRSETVTDGHRPLGRINCKAEGCETWGPDGEYLAKFPTIQAARKALFEINRDGAKGLAEA